MSHSSSSGNVIFIVGGGEKKMKASPTALSLLPAEALVNYRAHFLPAIPWPSALWEGEASTEKAPDDR